MFRGMAPELCECVVGRYRGCGDCSALTAYNVGVEEDPRVGIPPELVAWQMRLFEQTCVEACDAFEHRLQNPKGESADAILAMFARLLATMLERFLLIHPYANGNGHCSRLLIWVVMVRYGFPPKSWPLNRSPAYGEAIRAHRDGHATALALFLLRAIAEKVNLPFSS